MMKNKWNALTRILALVIGLVVSTGGKSHALTLTVGDTPKQMMRYGLDYERLWFWFGSALGQVPQWSVVDCDVDFIRTAMNSKYELTEGTYDLSAYTQKIIPMMTVMQNADPDIKWFASPRPLNEAVSGASWQPYPLWVTGASSYTSSDFDFNATKCAEYMIRYLLLMKSYGFKISYMDYTNEWQSNYASGGRFAPDDAVTIKQVFDDYLANPWPHPALDPNLLLVADDFPLMIGASAWNYSQGGQWASRFTTPERQDALDIVSSHNTDPTGSAQAFVNSARAAMGNDIEIWNTELHDWKSTSGYNEVTSFSYMIDAIRAGISGLSGWLAIGTPNQGHCYFLNNGSVVTRNVKYYIFKKLSNTSNYGHALDIDQPAELSATTALIKDDLLTIWVVNDSTTTQANVLFDLSGHVIAPGSTIKRTRWSESLAVEGVEDTVSQGSYSSFNSDVAGESLYCFEVSLASQPGPGIVARWSMDESSGTTVSDSGNFGFDATMSSASWVSGINGNALDFNGSSSSVSVPASAFVTTDDEITISMWAYGGNNQPQNNSVFYAVDSSGNRVLNVHLPWNNGSVYWDAGFSGGYDRIYKGAASGDYKGQWNHWVFTKNASSGNMSIYLNGSLWHSGTGKTRTMTGITSATIGSQISGLSYDGLLDDVQLYNVSLSATEISDLYQSYTVINGVPVAWLISYGLDPSDAGALADTDGDGLANWEEYAQGKNPTVSDNPPGIRVTEYYVSTGDFTGTAAAIPLNQNLADDYFILVRGSRDGSGLSLPNNDYARVTKVPGGFGEMIATAGSDHLRKIVLDRGAADFDWEGVITVVECTNSSSSDGFKLRDIVSTSLSGTSGTDSSASWSDLNQVVLFGGYRGGGALFTGAPTSRNQGTSVYTRLFPSGSGTLNWSRNAGGETLVDAVMTTFVVEWGSAWNVQRVNVAGSSGGNGADVTGEYTTAGISSVSRDNTWVWGTGTRADAGIGDSAEACLVTLGNGVNQNATESMVAVGSEYSDAYDFDVYTMTHSGLAVDHRFKADGDSSSTDLAVTVDNAASGTRMGWVYNGVNGTGTYFSRPRMWARYTADGEITVSRGFSGQNFPAWVQGIDFSGTNN